MLGNRRLQTSRLWFLALVLILTVLFAPGMKSQVPSALRYHETDEPLVPQAPPVKRHDVYELKERLRDLGFYAGAINEVYDTEAVEVLKNIHVSRSFGAFNPVKGWD